MNMVTVMPQIRCFDFVDYFGHPRFMWEPKYHHEAASIEDWVRSQPNDALIGFDLREVIYFGYSYAKQTIRECIKKQVRNELDDRRVMIIASIKGDSELLSGTEAALREADMAALWAESPEQPLEEWQVLGELAEHLLETFECLQRQVAPVSTASFAAMIDHSIPNTNNRLRDLKKYGLIERRKVTSKTGGYEWVNSVL